MILKHLYNKPTCQILYQQVRRFLSYYPDKHTPFKNAISTVRGINFWLHEILKKWTEKDQENFRAKSVSYIKIQIIFKQRKLDWANSAPTYPQTGHHSRNMFSLGIFVMGPCLCDIILRENMINHLYKNLSNSIYNIFIL